jgi:hypothetical protein
MSEVSGRMAPPYGQRVLIAAGEFTDKLLEIADDVLVAEREKRQNARQP